MKIGILGGSFNPPHQGHVRLAATAVDSLGLDRLVVIPARESPGKADGDDPGPEQRFDLCVAAFAGMGGVEVSRSEIDREGPSWTVETLREIAAANPDDELVLVLGEDVVAGLEGWRDPEDVVRLARIAWAPRPGAVDGRGSDGAIGEMVERLGGERPIELDMEPVDLASSGVRELLGAGQPADGLIPFEVLELIEKRGLYRKREDGTFDG